MFEIQMKFCTVRYQDYGCTTHFADGSFVAAIPHDTHHYHVIAHRCGYQDDILRYCREHEVVHSLIAEWFNDETSDVLWMLAHDEEPDAGAAAYEEALTQMVQRWLRGGERPIIGGVDWDGLKRHFERMMDYAEAQHELAA